MGTVYARGDIFWIGYADADGKWRYASAKTRVRAEAEATLSVIENAVAQGKAVAAAPQTFAAYAIAWSTERGNRRDEEKVWGADGELRLLKNHVFPMLGAMKLADVRPRHIRELVRQLKSKRSEQTGGLLSARHIRNIVTVVRTLFRDAVADELLEQTPFVLKSGEVPAAEDANPEWRDSAEYSREEVELLISSTLIPWNRRVWWAIGFLTGSRSGEIAALRWRHLVTSETPLQLLNVVGSYNPRHRKVKSTKTGRARRVPVHPLLAQLLAEWKAKGWGELMGRAPGPDDLLVPNEDGTYLSDWCTKKTRPRDLAALGLRHRRFHDARATFIGLGTLDGGEEVWLERVTHNAKGNQFNQYRRTHWPALCRAVLCLDVQLRRPLREGEAMAKPEELRFLQNGREGSRSLPSSSSGAAVGARSAGGGRVLEMRRPGSADGDRSGRSELRQRIDALVAAYARGGR